MAKRVRVKGKGAAIFWGEANPTSSQANKTSKTLEQHAGKSGNTSKATFYLPESLIDNLEDAWLALRKKYKGKKISKSEIVQIALEELLKDWVEKKDESSLVSQLDQS